jgi:predicted small lipoprotein YifL
MFVSLLTSRLTLRIAIGATLVAALGLAGCGRKGWLDPPPASTAADPGVVAQPAPEQDVGPDGKPLAPRQGPNKSTPVDWLID